MPKFLIIRFSSIGDIIQCLGIISGIRERFPDAEIHWITRHDMAPILTMDKRLDKVWAFDKSKGLKGLLETAAKLRKERYNYIYDAHSNIRSNILKLIITPFPGHQPYVVLRRKQRWKRFLLFQLGINRFEWPFRGMESYRKPLKKWGITHFPEDKPTWYFPQEFEQKYAGVIDKHTVTLVPSANWPMKRWPVDHWKKLVELLPDYRFVILGGPNDTFCEDIRTVAPERILNLTGKTTLLASCYLVHQSQLVISADTGFMHAADLFRVPALALMGPTAFGFPTGPKVEIVDVDLPCRPCTKDGRGKCKRDVYQQCMVDITPQRIAHRVRTLLRF